MYDLFAIISQNTNIFQSMDIKEVLKLVEELIYDHTGENLDYLPKTILQGTLEGQTYKKISEETYASETHVRYIGAKLWKTLSEILGENITKANFRTILENANIYNFAIGKNSITNNINICPSNPHASPIKTNSQQTPTQHIIDLDKAPEIINFYGRTEEISTMTKWIVSDRLRVISLLGISGIGKTTLSLRLIEEINGLGNQTPTFNYIIYRTLRFSPTLTTTLTNLLQIFAPETEVSDNIDILLSQLQKYLAKYSCWIIFDDVHKLFTPGKLAGQYKSGYANYRDFFQLFATVSHQSCLLLISREKIAEIFKLETENYPVETLILGSLGASSKAICQRHKLVNQESWEKLINNYQGNPQWLDITATIIQELFRGKVAEFMEYKTLILPEALQAELEQQLQNLSPLEIRMMKQIANQSQPISIAEISRQSQLSIQENINLIQSLKKRLLLYGQLENNLTVFTLNSIWNQYLKNKN